MRQAERDTLRETTRQLLPVHKAKCDHENTAIGLKPCKQLNLLYLSHIECRVKMAGKL